MSEENTSGESHVGSRYQGKHDTYHIEDSLGEGGMGQVCLAKAESDGRSVAVKFLKKELQEESVSAQERFEREIKVLYDLRNYPGIVRIQDYAQTPDGTYFLVMEYIAAPTLDKVLKDTTGGLPQIQCVQIAIHVLTVLAPMHRQGYLHRDIKPSNICYDDDNQSVRLLDFGLSKPLQAGARFKNVTVRQDGRHMEITGSPHYMAPEQMLRPRDVDARSDLYAVGITLYELLAGYPPFRGIYQRDIIEQQQKKAPPPIEAAADGGPISYRLQTVLNKALAKEQSGRYQNADEFKESLFDVLHMLSKINQERQPLGDRFRILRKIGEGGNAEVFEAQDQEEGGLVALKVVREGSSDWDVETLVNEADRALNHENIVKVIKFGTYEGRDALVMELMDGGTVETLLEQFSESGMPRNYFYPIVRDVARGLHHAHKRGIVHRDVKPSNMLRTAEGKTKLCDFGIAKPFDRTEEGIQGQKTMEFKGTSIYSSPEQNDINGRVGPCSDIYALGICMYEFLSGDPPFFEGVLTFQHLNSEPPPLHVKGKYKNPDALCAVVERCLMKNPEHRFQSMKELAQELARIYNLQPQSHAHKPYEMRTIQEEPTQVDGSTARTEFVPPPAPAKRGPATLVLAGVAAAILLFVGLEVGGVIDVIPGSGPEGNRGSGSGAGNGSGGGTTTDPKREELQMLRAAVVDADWVKVESHEFRHLEPGSEGRKDLYGTIEREFRKLTLAFEARRPKQLHDERLVPIHAAMANVDEEGATTKQLGAFLRQLEGWATGHELPESGFAPWRVAELDSLVAAGKALDDQEAWDEFRRAEWERIRDHNVTALGAALLAATGEASELDDVTRDELRRVAGFQEANQFDTAASLQVFNRLRGWVQARAVASMASGGPIGFFDQMKGALTDLFQLDEAGVQALYDDIGAQNYTTPTDYALRGAVVAGVRAAIQQDDRLQKEIQEYLGFDMFAWANKVETLVKSAPSSFVSPIVSQAACANLTDPEIARFFDRTVGARGPERRQKYGANIGKIKAAVDDVMAHLDGGQAELDRQWQTVSRSLEPGSPSAGETHVADLKALTAESTVDEIYAIVFSALAFGANDAAIKAEVTSVVDKLINAGRWLSLALLKETNPALDTRVNATELTKNVVGSISDIQSSLGKGPFNLAWQSSGDAMIEVRFKLPEPEATIPRSSVTVRSGDNSVEEEDGVHVVRVRPDSVVERDGALVIVIDVTVRYKNRPYAFRIEREEQVPYDFEAPAITGLRADLPSTTVSARVEDDRAKALKPELKVNGTVIAPSGSSAPDFAWKLELQDLAKASAGSDSATITVADELGNTSTAQADRQVRDIRRALIRAIELQLENAEANIRGLRGLTQARSLRTIIDDASRTLTDNRDWLERRSTLAQRILGTARLLVSGWLGGASKADAEQAKADLEALFAALDGLRSAHAVGGEDVVTELRSKLTTALAQSGSGGNTSTTETKKWWETASLPKTITALGGLKFHLVRPDDEPPGWVCEVELSVATMARYNSTYERAVDPPIQKGWSQIVSGDRPLVPLTRTGFQRHILEPLNDKAKDTIGAVPGPVRFDAPTRKQWEAAARIQVGSDNLAQFAWGGTSFDNAYRFPGNHDEKSISTYSPSLSDVRSDPNGGPFYYLSGNASELVRSSATSTSASRLKGGSVGDDFKQANRRRLRLSGSVSTRSDTMFAGVRLAIVPD